VAKIGSLVVRVLLQEVHKRYTAIPARGWQFENLVHSTSSAIIGDHGLISNVPIRNEKLWMVKRRLAVTHSLIGE